jgi:hypothetical protein
MADAKFVAFENVGFIGTPELSVQATVRAPLKITVSPQWVRILPHLRVVH